MALLRKLLHKKPPDGLLEVFDRTYVFDSCFRTTTWEQDEYKDYVSRNFTQFKETYPESMPCILNFWEGDKRSKIEQILSERFISVTDYPRHYEGCPLLSMKLIYHFLKSCETWLSFGQHNILLMHSELGGWPVLAFMLAALLLYRNNVTSESRALEMIHKQVPPDYKVTMMSRLDPSGSQLRYLQYVSKRNAEKQWLPDDEALRLDCVIIRMIPDFNGKGGCCPVFKIYGRDPSLHVDKPPKLLFSTPRWRLDDKTPKCSSSIPQWRRNVRSYNQLENKVVKSDINRNLQGDVVLECINLNDDMVNGTIMYRVMFNTAFITSNTLILNREEVDIHWDKKEQFPKDFKVELLFSEVDATTSTHPRLLIGGTSSFPRVPASRLPVRPPPRPVPRPPLPPPPKIKLPPPSPHISCPPPPPPPKLPPPAPSLIGGGIAAPSPPPPIIKAPVLIRKTAVKSQPAKRLKPLHWSKMNRVQEGSLWAEAQKSGEAARSPKFDMSELETLFSVLNPNSDKVPKEIIKVQLIEHRRAFNCEIMLSKVKIPLPELMDYVLALDDSAMDVDQVDNLIKCCPTVEEMELIKGYKGEREKLGKCEQFCMELMKVPRSEAKLIIYSYKLQFSTQVSDLRDSLNTVYLSAEQIMSSVKLRRIMQTILDLGNALNQGTARGAAVGFKLDSLLKLNETRTSSNKMTLMHYLCKVLADNMPELLNFSKELNSLETASKIHLKALTEEIQAFTKGLEKVVQEKKLCAKDGHASECYRKSLEKFLAFAEPNVKCLVSLYSGMGKRLDTLIIYFGEDPARRTYESVVSTLLSFVGMFNRAHEENCKKIEAEKKAAFEAAEQEKLKAAEQNKLKAEENEKLEVQNHSKIEYYEVLVQYKKQLQVNNWYQSGFKDPGRRESEAEKDGEALVAQVTEEGALVAGALVAQIIGRERDRKKKDGCVRAYWYDQTRRAVGVVLLLIRNPGRRRKKTRKKKKH